MTNDHSDGEMFGRVLNWLYFAPAIRSCYSPASDTDKAERQVNESPCRSERKCIREIKL
jgi:hypothetical protein